MSHAGENHRDAMLVGCRDDLFIFDRAARLNVTTLTLAGAQ